MKISIDTRRPHRLLFALAFAALLPVLYVTVGWYHTEKSDSNRVTIEITGTFLKRGNIDISTVRPDKTVNSIDKIIYRPFGGKQVLRIRVPLEFNNESLILRFSQMPSDSLIVDDIRFITTEIDTVLNLSKQMNKDAFGNIIAAPSGTDVQQISKQARNRFLVISPSFTYQQNKSHSSRWMLVFALFSLFLLIGILFYRKLHLLSYFYLLISALALLIVSFVMREVNFRSLMYPRTTSAPTMEIGMVVPVDESISLYWSTDPSGTGRMNEDQKIKFAVNGATEVQHFKFQLPEEERITRLKFYLGRLPVGKREIHYLRFRKYDYVINIPLHSIPSFFTVQHHLKPLRYGNNHLSISIKDQSPYLETQNNITYLLEPLYNYQLNPSAGFYFSLMIAVFVFFCLYFSKFDRSATMKEIQINL